MKHPSLLSWFRNISISKKLYFTLGIMALLIATELFTLWFSVYMLSAVRASVEEEGRWSKAQKDAVYTIQKYAQTGSEEDYVEFQDHLKINYGNKKAFGELEKDEPDQQIMMESWVEAGIHPDDVKRVTKLFLHFGFVSYIKRCIEIYHEADQMMDELEMNGRQLHLVINESGISSNKKTESILDRIYLLNREFTRLEIEFSSTLGESARWLENLVLKILLTIALTVEISGLLLTISVSRGIAKGINEIIRASKQVAAGNFNERAVAYSKDEIGQLASSFNEMTGDLERNTKELKKSEEQLQQFKHFFINSNDLSCIANVEGYFEVLNPNFEKILGYSEKELLENQFLAFIHPDDIPATLQEIDKLKTGAVTINFVNRYRKKDGDYLWLDWNSTPDPVTGKLYAIARDITKSKKAEEELKESEERYRTLSESALDAIIIGDETGKIQSWNKGAELIFGYTSEEIIGAPLTELMPQSYREAHEKGFKRFLKTGEPKVIGNVVSLEGQRKNGEIFPLELSLSTWETSRSRFFSGIIRDITERKRAQDALKHANDTLELRVKERTVELEKVNKTLINRNSELKKINEDIDNFIYSASHDLKTPILNLEALLNVFYKKTSLDESSEGITEKIDVSIKQIEARINRLAQISQVQRNLFDDVKEVKFEDILVEIFLEIEHIIIASGAEIKSDFSKAPILEFSRTALKSIIYNFVNNALKYRSPDRIPKVTIKTEKKNEYLILSVKDNGLGIDLEKDEEKVFAMFKRLHDHVEGAGIGLYMVKRMVENNGGMIKIESELDRGTTFFTYFRLRRET